MKEHLVVLFLPVSLKSLSALNQKGPVHVMAQLRYSKAIACGTAITVGLVGAYLYKKRSNRRVLRKSLGEEKPREPEKKGEDCRESKCAEEIRLTPHHQCKETCTAGCECGKEEEKEVVTKVSEKAKRDAMETPERKPVEGREETNDNTQTDEDKPMYLQSAEQAIEDPIIANDKTSVEKQSPVNDGDRSAALRLAAQGIEDLIIANDRKSVEMQPPVIEETLHETISHPEVFTENPSSLDQQVPHVSSEREEHLGDWASAVEEAERNKATPVKAKVTARSRNSSANASANNNTSNNHVDSSMAGSDGGSEGSSDSGHGSIDTSLVGKDQAASPELPPSPILYQFEFPTDLCGRLIGKQGRNIKELRDKTGAKIFLKPLAVSTKYQLCIIDGLPKSIEKALELIKKRFPEVDTKRQSLTADSHGQNVKMPSMSQLHLSDEAINAIILTSVVSAGHVFMQQPGHPSFSALNRLNNCMNQCYCQSNAVPSLPEPIEVGIVCAAPVMDSWYRAQLINYYPEENEADLRFLDYGGYARIDASCLRQIRSDFLSLPFQAVECYLSNVVPLQGEADFSEEARLFIEQVAQNVTLLQAKTVAYSMDGIPLIEIFYEEAENGNVHSVNRELVERGLAAWYEGLEETVPEVADDAFMVPAT